MTIPNNEIWVKMSDDKYLMSIDTSGFVEEYVGTFRDNATGYYKYRFASDITIVGTYALDGNSYLEEVILPETVTSIGKYAFNGSSGLKSINFPESLKKIDTGAFSYCSNLTTVELKHVERIETEAFMGCYRIATLDLGDSLKRIGTRAFYSNNMKGKIKELTIPATVTYIGGTSFFQCGVETIHFLPSPIPEFGTNPFAQNTITKVTIPLSAQEEYEAYIATVTQMSGATIEVFNDIPINPKEEYFWVEFEETGGVISGLTNSYTDMYHSFDGSTWIETPNTLSMGDNTIVYFKNESKKFSDLFKQSTITFNSNVKVGGDLSSITDITEYCCYGLFKNNTFLTDASELILPWDTSPKFCYYRMFQGCTSLVTAPKLPATTLADWCYTEMFYGCTSLVTAPSILPATILAESCYASMFQGCTSLVTAPELPSIFLVKRCYEYMFYGCKKLNYIKMLAIYIGAEECLSYWVYNVAPTGTFIKHPENTTIEIDSSNGIPKDWTVVNAEISDEPLIPNNEYFWIQFEEAGGVISGLTNSDTDMYHSFDGNTWTKTPNTLLMTNVRLVYFRNESKKIKGLSFQFNSNAKVGGDLSSMTDMAERCCYGLFNSNIYLTDASELILPWDTLAKECYSTMFRGCTNLIAAPELPATTLAFYCYYKMFEDCTSLVTAPVLPATTLDSWCYSGMFQGCTSLVTAPKLPATTLVDRCYYFMFEGCTSLVTAPELPATTLVESCYASMFQGCTSLVTAPVLPANTLVDWCYESMFMGCNKLNYIKMMATDISSSNCLRSWVYNVSPTGTFIKHPENTTIEIDSSNGIPKDWTVYNDGDPNIPHFELEYNELEVEKQYTATILNLTINNITEIFIEHPWWSSFTDKGGYIEIEILENDGLPREEVITFIGITPNGDRINQTLTIRQKGIEDMATSISLYKTRLDYPSDGGVKYVQVDYINPTTINDPYCFNDWVTIELTQQGNTTQGVNQITQRQYRITIDSTSAARQTNVRFSCTTASGSEVYTDKLILYQAAPTGNTETGEVAPFITEFTVLMDGTPETESNTSIKCGYNAVLNQTPIADAGWIHIGAGVADTGVSTFDTVMEYPISFDANTGVTRSATITFKGIDNYGNVITAITTVTQYGEDAPVDEGMIELQSLSMTLPAGGGSGEIVVKYYDAATIYEPEFVGDWATITKTNTTKTTGIAFNGYQCLVTINTYRITAQPTTTGRVAKVVFKADINYYDGSTVYVEKDRFRVNQLAPESEDIQGIVYPFRNTLTFNHKGISETWDSIKVGYKDLEVMTPDVNVNWFRIKSTIDKTYGDKEYDYIYEYTLEVDENTGTKREGTITFIGNAEDGTQNTSVVKIIQLGYESDIDTVATNYKGYFKSMDGVLYSVAFITNPNYDSYGEITLAGESPVVVSYTDNGTLYEPVRTSTCTVKVVSTQYLMNLYTGKAQGTQVILRNEDDGTIEWCGYLQPNLYNQGYSSEIEEIEFEASDCISTLQYLKYEDYYVNGRMSVPFSYIIGDIMDKTKLIKSYYMTEKYFTDGTLSKQITFNPFYISEHNFFSEEDEPWTLLEVLEETCKFFGFVCYQLGDSIYFMDYDRFNDSGKMTGYRYDKSSNWATKNAVVISSEAKTITAESYRETGADMSLDDVFNKVSVNCNYYNVEDIIPDLFDDEFLTNRIDDEGYLNIKRYAGPANSHLRCETYYRLYDHKNVNQFYYSLVDGVGSTTHEVKVVPTTEQKKEIDIIDKFVGANIVDMIHLSYDEANDKVGDSKDWERYLLISQLNRPWCGAEGTFHWEEYNLPLIEFKNIPTIFLDNTETGRPGIYKPKNYLVIDAQAAFTAILKNPYLNEDAPKGMKYKNSIDCYVYEDEEKNTYNFDETRIEPALCFYLEIPSKGWWNGSEWVDGKTYFEVPLEKLDREKDFWNTDKAVENTVGTNLFLGSTGYKIPLPDSMTSTESMYFAIGMPRRTAHLAESYGGDHTGAAGNAYCFIKDLKMSIQNIYSILYSDKDEVIENIIEGDNVIEGPEIDLKITSDNGQGYSLSNVAVMGTDDVLTTNFDFYSIDNEILAPEEVIIKRYVNQYSTPSVKENVTVDMSFKPFHLINDSWWKKDFVMTAAEIDYKESKQIITLLEKK